MKARLLRIMLLAVAAVSLPASAIDYRSLSARAILYDAPSTKAKPLFIVKEGTPVEAVVSVDGWVKVRDIKGDLSWVEKRNLSDTHTISVRAATAQVREQPNDNAPLVFEAERDVVLEMLDPPAAGWVKVKHRDGQTGYVKLSQVWGA